MAEASLNDQERGEIALKLLKARYAQEGVRIGKDMHREIVSRAKELGIDPAKAFAFAREIIQELLEEHLYAPMRRAEQETAKQEA